MDRVSKAERELVRKIQKQTNADRIRAMTDEELAEFITPSSALIVIFWIAALAKLETTSLAQNES